MNLTGDENRFVVEFIKDENKLVIHTDRFSDDMNESVTLLLESVVLQNVEVVRYNHHIEISWRDINKYAACKTFEDMMAVDPEKNVMRSSTDIETFDLTSTGEWHYPLPEFQRMIKANTVIPSFLRNVKNETLTLNLPKLITPKSLCAGLKYVNHVYLIAPKATTVDHLTYPSGSTKFESFHLYAPNAENFHWSFYNNTYLKSFYIESINKNAIDFENVFYQCYLNRESVIDFCNKLPICRTNNQYHKTVTLGIHVDHKYDPDVNLALKKVDINYTPTVELPEEVTEGKGWTLTVQWNGTPTSTASTMDMGTLIYAKVSEHELPDGTTEQYLDWGHYVTDETGYETFRSLESAYKYFNLEQPTEF